MSHTGYNKFKRTFRDAQRENFIDARKTTNLTIGYDPQPTVLTKDESGKNFIQLLPTKRHFSSNKVYLKQFPQYRIISCDDDDDDY